MNPDSLFNPVVPAQAQLPEFTWRAVLVGTVLGMVFGASSLYLVLKVGLTVSASIPVAVISLTLFRLLSRVGVRDATILENNIAQTAGSAGESIAFGVGITMPALLILGFDLELSRVMLVALIGALLGIVMMIPLRRTLIVGEHGRLAYPEGTACAEVLKAGAASNSSPDHASGARAIFLGFGIGVIYKVMMSAFKLWKDVPSKALGGSAKTTVGMEVSPELLGVGYLIGPAIAATMCAGGVLTYLCLIPMIHYFGGTQMLSPGVIPVDQMSVSAIRNTYVLYIGAGAVTAAGIISLIKALPSIIGSVKQSVVPRTAHTATTLRTDRDLPPQVMLGGLVLLMLVIMSAPALQMNWLGALLLLMFGFLFVSVSSRLTGTIGSSSNPISGMTIATLLLTCLVFLLLGWTERQYYVTALCVGGVVCVAAANGGTTSQDLKTGYLVGATPRLQQYAILIGSAASALILGPILLQLNQSATVYVPVAQIAPQGLQVNVAELTEQREQLQGVQADSGQQNYRVWFKHDEQGAPSGKYLVDAQGQAQWLVDPGINGRFAERPDGSTVQKFDAPKAVLASYIIKGVLDRNLPWELVWFGVAIALVVEMCGLNALPFAVGVYLPLSTTAPILLGGLVRWWSDRRRTGQDLPQGQGMLLASGYIAGGAIAGVLVALLAGGWTDADARLTAWMAANNPLYAGPWADALALLPFAALILLLLRAAHQRAARL